MRGSSVLVMAIAVPWLSTAFGATVTIPAGTQVFGELQEVVSSNEDEFSVGQFVRGTVWRNVVVDGVTVIPAGSEMSLQISAMQKRRAFGRGGNVEVRALSVKLADGTEIFLDGGYDKKGQNRVVLSATLFALVAWPTAFIKGKEAVLPPGTIFDASVPANTRIAVADDRPPTIRLGGGSGLSVEVLYDEIEEKAKYLPIRATLCDREWLDPFHVSAVNDAPLAEPIDIDDVQLEEADGCQSARGTIRLKDLADHFVKGINRFTVAVADETTEVILDVEM